VSGTCIVPPTQGSTGDRVHFLVGIRSNESDGTGGVAGLVSYDQRAITIIGGPPSGFIEHMADTGATSANPGFGGAPVNSIPTKSPMTSTTQTSFPFALITSDQVIDLTDNNYTGFASRPMLGTSNGGVTPRFINFTIRFNDLTPNPNNPGA
jgi:hypothetical protein